MPHKTFNDEVFTIKNLKLELNSLTESDPYVDHVKIMPESDNVEVLKYSANKKVVQSGVQKDTVTGLEFEAESEEKEDQRVSELPEVIKKIKAKIDEGNCKVKTDIGRYTDEDGNNASFYITDHHLEELEFVEDEEESANEEAEDDEENSDEGSEEDSDSGSDVIF